MVYTNERCIICLKEIVVEVQDNTTEVSSEQVTPTRNIFNCRCNGLVCHLCATQWIRNCPLCRTRRSSALGLSCSRCRRTIVQEVINPAVQVSTAQARLLSQRFNCACSDIALCRSCEAFFSLNRCPACYQSRPLPSRYLYVIDACMASSALVSLAFMTISSRSLRERSQPINEVAALVSLLYLGTLYWWGESAEGRRILARGLRNFVQDFPHTRSEFEHYIVNSENPPFIAIAILLLGVMTYQMAYW